MLRIRWYVDHQAIELTERGRHGALGMTLSAPGAPPVMIPPRTLGEWSIPFEGRTIVVRSTRTLAELQFQLFSDGHLIPQVAQGQTNHRASAPSGAHCANHEGQLAACACLRCGVFACRNCAPDGAHCAPCLVRFAGQVARESRRTRNAALGAGLLAIVIGGGSFALSSSPTLRAVAGAMIAVTLLMTAQVFFTEWRDRTHE